MAKHYALTAAEKTQNTAFYTDLTERKVALLAELLDFNEAVRELFEQEVAPALEHFIACVADYERWREEIAGKYRDKLDGQSDAWRTEDEGIASETFVEQWEEPITLEDEAPTSDTVMATLTEALHDAVEKLEIPDLPSDAADL